jgi:hypothetical protein
MVEICKNCKTEVTQNYCPNCGHPAILKRIDGQYILQEIGNVLNFEKGILFTIRELAINPGKSIIDFLHTNRNRLVKPIVFLIVSSLFYTLLNDFFHFDESFINYSDHKEFVTPAIFAWVQGNYGYANIIMAFFIGIWLKIFFNKYQSNFFEILVVLCFVMSMGMLIYSVFGIFQGLTYIKSMLVAAVVVFLYTTYAVGQFFDKRKLSSYVKVFIAYLLGMISFSLAALLIGIIIDLIIQK